MSKIEIHNETGGLQKFSNFVIFKTADGKVNIDVFFKDETLWLTQKAISVLFEKDRTVIGRHLKNIFESGEMDEKVVCANFALNHSTWRYGRKNAGERGKFSIFEAKLKAESEYEKFRVVQDKLFESDFDRFLKQLKEKTKE